MMGIVEIVTKMKIIIYYCKACKGSGQPIMVRVGKSVINTDSVKLDGVKASMKFNNSEGKVKASGATTVLEVPILK